MSEITTDAYFGGCPECGANDGYLNVERVHWCVCNTHSMKWRIGENLFSSWKDESPEKWEQNRQHLARYTGIRPIYPKPAKKELQQLTAEWDAYVREAAEVDQGYGVIIGPDGVRALGSDDDRSDVPY